MRSPSFFGRTPFDAAIRQLRDGRPGEAGYGRRVVQLLTIPTFDDPVARDVRRAASGELYVVRTVWHRALDMPSRATQASRRSFAPGLDILDLVAERKPTLWSTNVSADVEAIDRLLESLASTAIPCHPCHSEPALAATIFELTFGEELNETRYRWGGEPPHGWAPLADFAARLLRLVDEPAGARRR